MTDRHLEDFKEALMNFGASDLNENILKEVSLKQLLDWSCDERHPKLCFRSAWALEHILLKNISYFKEVYKTLIINYANLNNWSSLRSYTKLIMWLLSKSNTSIKLDEKERELLLEKTFQIIENSVCPIAVKVNGFEILYRLIPFYDWLAKELKLLIDINLEKENTPAMKSRGSYILKKLG